MLKKYNQEEFLDMAIGGVDELIEEYTKNNSFEMSDTAYFHGRYLIDKVVVEFI